MRRQFGVISHRQLIAYGYGEKAIRHRVRTGRLHRLFRGVYAVGRKEVPREGIWTAAVLACGDGARLAHESAGELMGCWSSPCALIHVCVERDVRVRGIKIHRAKLRPEDTGTYHGIPVTSPARTLTDLATKYGKDTMERAINGADKADLITIEELHDAVEAMPPRTRGRKAMRKILEPATFTLTDSELEQRFVPIARAAGLSKPKTQHRVNGHKVDFYFDDIDLVVETDGGTFHRTPTQQTSDRRRDHAHATAGTTALRFTHHQIAKQRTYVQRVLEKTRLRIQARGL